MTATTLLLAASAIVIAVIAGLALKDAPRVLRSLRGGLRAKGQIVRDETVMFQFRPLHFPVVMFRDGTGALHEVQSRYQKKTSAREQMNEVEVAYLPGNPAKTAVLVGWRYYFPTLVNALIFIILAGGIPAMLMWAQR